MNNEKKVYKKLLVGCLFGSALAFVVFSNVMVYEAQAPAIGSNIHTKLHEYVKNVPLTFEDLPKNDPMFVLDDVVIVVDKRVIPAIVKQPTEKKFVCGKARASLVGGNVRSCEWR